MLAEQGLRGPTHREVDRTAGLPEGSTSAHLRTRRVLQLALAQNVDQLVTAVDQVLASPHVAPPATV